MPTLVADANLPTVGTETFFNEFEGDLRAAIIDGGEGYYKLTQEKTGAFTAVEAVTEIPEEAVLNEGNDRFVLIGEEQDFLFLHFSV